MIGASFDSPGINPPLSLSGLGMCSMKQCVARIGRVDQPIDWCSLDFGQFPEDAVRHCRITFMQLLVAVFLHVRASRRPAMRLMKQVLPLQHQHQHERTLPVR